MSLSLKHKDSFRKSLETQRKFLAVAAEIVENANGNKKVLCDFEKWLDIREKIGSGSFGSATKVCLLADKRRCGILKIIKFKNKETKDSFFNEAAIFIYMLEKISAMPLEKQLNYRNLVFVFEAGRCPKKMPGGNRTGYIILEKGADTLENLYKIKKRTVRWWKEVIRQVANAIHALETLKINHNDPHVGNWVIINPDNISKMVVKLIDFGSASTGVRKLKKQLRPGQETYFFDNAPETFRKGRDLKLFLEDLEDELEDGKLNVSDNTAKIISNEIKKIRTSKFKK